MMMISSRGRRKDIGCINLNKFTILSDSVSQSTGKEMNLNVTPEATGECLADV